MSKLLTGLTPLRRWLSSKSFPQPPDPASCCGSGCQNCVWIQYAEAVHHFMEQHPSPTMADSSVKVAKLMEENVKDPNLRAYLMMEIKMKTP